MKKKIMAVLLACALAVGMTVSPVGMETVKAEETENGLRYTENDDGSITISGYSGSDTEIVIDEKINGKPVTAIGENVFWNCSSLTSITIPEGVTSIGGHAFYGCSSLTGITIPEGITSIGDGVFQGCSGLTSITIPEGVTSIGGLAFLGCNSLTEITIPKGVTSIGGGSFSGCGSLKIIVDSENSNFETDAAGILYDKGKTILICCPQDRTGEISIPSSVTSIGSNAFWGCNSLTGITIPKGVTSIGGAAFKGCSGLTEIIIPSGVTSIARGAFRECSSLTKITIPEGITSINDYTFFRCSSLTGIIIPKGVTKIGDEAFDDCSSLTEITIPESVTFMGDYAFAGCDSLKNVYYAGSQEQWDKIIIYDRGRGYLDSVTIHYNSTNSGMETSAKTPQSITAKDITKTYGAKAFSLNAKVNTKTALTYASSDKKVATIDKKGKITIKGCGITNITITAPATEKYKQAKKTIKLTVKPKKVTLSSVKSTKKKTAVVKWKQDKKASGYIIQFATDSKFKKNKVQKNVSKNKTVSYTVKKLKAGKKYYVRVCAYAKSGKTEVRGDWSKAKTVNVKK